MLYRNEHLFYSYNNLKLFYKSLKYIFSLPFKIPIFLYEYIFYPDLFNGLDNNYSDDFYSSSFDTYD